ncbi:phage minor capsid protein [Pediococcus pentosaceus]|uniref:phage minor capsid protein n=1 Tax=Pediococcus pentosaceus TaxID=1255 RepID=UPI003D76ECB3
MITEKDMANKANSIVDLYSELQQQIIFRIVDLIHDSKFDSVDENNVLLWQVEQLNRAGLLTEDTIQLLSSVTDEAEAKIKSLVLDNGQTVNTEINQQLTKLTSTQPKVLPNNQQILNGLLNQTYKDLNNVTNESVGSRNQQNNTATRAFRDIINKTTVETISGLKTHERAINDAIYRMIDSGLQTNLVDSAGRRMSLEGYIRSVINTTTHRTFNETRMNSMDGFGVTLVTMDSHPSARPACAPIQGHVVNRVPRSDTKFDPDYDTIYDHGYGEAGGTQGINCHHSLFPFIKGVNTNPFGQYDPDEAIAKGKIQQKQRALERNVRLDKKKLEVAKRLDDEDGINHYKNMLANHRAKIRSLVKDNDFLYRDYSREKIYD